jgi:ornithine carbamoyltransferase
MPLNSKDLISLYDLTPEEMEEILDLAGTLKGNPGHYASALQGQTLAMIFEKPSLRTRVTFEAGMTQLGGHAIYLAPSDAQIGQRESVPDVARNLERWVDGIMARTFAHQTVVDLARYASIPVINGLSDYSHPVQGLADYMTLKEVKGDLAGRTLAYVGDGNNVANSLLFGGAKLGVNVRVATPSGYAPDPEVVRKAKEDAEKRGARIEILTDPREAVQGADAVYTDVWASMGQESEAAERREIFRHYQVNTGLMTLAGEEAVFMHCLPAHRGEEVTDMVCDSPASVIFQQAENRLHAQKAVMVLLMG